MQLVKYNSARSVEGRAGMPMRLTEIILLIAVVIAFFWIIRSFGGG